MVKDEDLYEDLSKEQIEEYKREVKEKYDPKIVAESNRNVARMSKEQFEKIKQEGDEIVREFTNLMEKENPDSDRVQKLVALHHKHIGNFYRASLNVYRGLGNLYVKDERFRAYFDKYKTGVADFVKKAIDYYCDHAA